MGYHFENILGKFDFTSKFGLSKKPGVVVIDEKNIFNYREVLQFFKKEEYFSDFRLKNLEITLHSLELSYDDDYHIRYLIKEIDNLLKMREKVKDERLLKEFDKTVDKKKKALEVAMQGFCPNLLVVAGALVGARMIQTAGSLKRLSLKSARKIQVLGAESAFFKFLMKKGKKMPEYGLLYHHELVKKSEVKGKVARLLADKIAIAVKVDFFKGDFVGEKLRKEIEDKIN